MPRAIDRESLLVQEIANAANEQNFVMLVIAAIAPPLHRLQLRELLLPVPQHVRFHRTKLAHLANREIALGGNRRQRCLSSAGFGHGSPLRPWPSTSGSRGTSRRVAR